VTVEELIKKAEFATDEVYSFSEWQGFIEDVLQEINPFSKVLRTKSDIQVTVTNNVAELDIANYDDLAKYYEILAVFYNGEKLRHVPLHDNYSRGWKLVENKIIIQGVEDGEGTLRVDYYETLYITEVEKNGEYVHEINLPEKYHHVVLKGMCVKATQKEEEMTRKQDFQAEYIEAVNTMASERILEMEPWNKHIYVQQKVGK